MQWCMDEAEEEEPRNQNHSAAKKVQHKKPTFEYAFTKKENMMKERIN